MRRIRDHCMLLSPCSQNTWDLESKEGVAPLTVTPNNPLTNFNRFGNFMHVDLEILVPLGRILSPEGKTMAPVNGQ